jgi:hypothetical protein
MVFEIRLRGNSKYITATVACGAWFMMSLWMVLRRAGFTTDYPRVSYLATYGEYKTDLNPGAIPDNPFLPNHMRLDRISYLDHPSTYIPVMNKVDLSVRPQDLIQTYSDEQPESAPTVNVRFGWIRGRTIVTSNQAKTRYIDRRIPLPGHLSPEEEYKIAKGEMAPPGVVAEPTPVTVYDQPFGYTPQYDVSARQELETRKSRASS